MGFLDIDGGSVVSRRSAHYRSPSSSSKHKHKHGSSRDGDRERERDRSRTRATAPTNRTFFGLESVNNKGHGRHARASSSLYEYVEEAESKKHSAGHHSHSRSRSRSPAGFGAGFFAQPNGSARSVFSSSGVGGRPAGASFYRRSPRSGFLHRTYRKLRRLLRDLLYYAKKHPLKVFLLAVMPLLTGGALAALLARFGLRLPPAIARMLGFGVRAAAASSDSIGVVSDAVRMASVTGAASGSAASAGAGVGASRNLRHPPAQQRDYFRASRAAASSTTGTDFYGSDSTSSHGRSGGGWGASLARFFS
ncbi:hypothetical protein CMQ_229 [Grosmannia clavigera kw1407]|uniref:Uncharacterized protein n=1 Tax=Grosmannia clavigera (strain kw1407 / UAMH 11150) TaxID=655863 RepID=F0XR70_GROCL|nr:uncharacterized protein CMQ_229 [Grosmannia clavigera kw1407]EFW99911.1 hypothetical protein CMQ_229 [Grosmannia clavigera kw1407]